MITLSQGSSGGQPDKQCAELRWLDVSPASMFNGTTLGVPWPQGMYRPRQSFVLHNDKGAEIPLQTWALAYWPDGSLKWTAHAIACGGEMTAAMRLSPGESEGPLPRIIISETADTIEVDTGTMKCRIGRAGKVVIRSIERNGRVLAQDGELVCLRQDRAEAPEDGNIRQERSIGFIEKAVVEQAGPLRAAVCLQGTHKSGGARAWLPFVLRLYFYWGGNTIRVMHTFIYDGDEHKDFVRGIGLRFAVPMHDQLHDRHIRFTGQDNGLWAEAVRGLTGLRRDPGQTTREAQVAGMPAPSVEEMDPRVANRLKLIPAWGDFTLSQLSADGFQIRKRTKPGHGWIAAGAGKRASGAGYVGGVSGGMAFGIRHFWQKHPSQLDIRGAASDKAEVTMWLWSPDAPAMDMRFYHDGMGMTSHREELEGLNITYEDYEKGWGVPMGAANTSEMTLWATTATPSRQQMIDFAAVTNTPPLLICPPEQYLKAKVFGAFCNLPDRSTPAKALIEDQLDFSLDYYMKQVEQRRWYGFWDFGDVMHSYDHDRHVWRYDVGGYAWANSELSPDLWLWYSFLRTGRADVFRMAEAMTRHTGEVDVHHLGRFKGLGSRHNVQHWGCSCKQLRISNVIYRRFYYYLTADERVGDLMREQLDGDLTFLTIDPMRKLRRTPFVPRPDALAIGTGNSWGCLAAAWLTEWERTGGGKYRDKLLNSMKSIGELPKGFFTWDATYDPNTGRFTHHGGEGAGVSGLNAVFGLAEVCAELIMLTDVPGFEKAWLDYCRLYNADPAERQKELGAYFESGHLRNAHSRLTAYAAWRLNDPNLARRAWHEFLGPDGTTSERRARMTTRRLEGSPALNPIDEAPGVSTNGTSQWGLAAMQNLALAGEFIPPLEEEAAKKPLQEDKPETNPK